MRLREDGPTSAAPALISVSRSAPGRARGSTPSRASGLPSGQSPYSRPLSTERDALRCVRHDLRSAIHAIVGFTGLLASEAYGPISDEQAECLEHIRVSSERLQTLVQALSELSAPATQYARAELNAIPLGPILRQTMLGLAADHDYLPAHVDLDAELETLRAPLEGATFRAGLTELTKAITKDYRTGFHLSASLHGAQVQLLLIGMASPQRAIWVVPDPTSLVKVDEVGESVQNLDFIALKLAENYFARLGWDLLVSRTADLAQISMPVPEPALG